MCTPAFLRLADHIQTELMPRKQMQFRCSLRSGAPRLTVLQIKQTKGSEMFKKTLAAAALLGAFAGSAVAADVTLYGVVDYGLQYTHVDSDKANTDAVSAAFGQYKTETEGYIRTGIVGYDGAVPVYGVAVGQGLTVTDVDGETVVDQNNFRATFTAQRLSFWQDANEVAYVSNNRLYITNITVLEGVTLGKWQITTASGLAFRWIGG